MSSRLLIWMGVTFAAVFLCGCETSRVLIVPYDTFGPQVIASELIGMSWYQWNSHGDDTGAEDDVRVVIHRGGDGEWARREYPVVKGKSDYRYVEADAALKFIDDKIKELEKDFVSDPEYKGVGKEIIAKMKKAQNEIAAWKNSPGSP